MCRWRPLAKTERAIEVAGGLVVRCDAQGERGLSCHGQDSHGPVQQQPRQPMTAVLRGDEEFDGEGAVRGVRPWRPPDHLDGGDDPAVTDDDR